jgi:hypothetical protein
LRLLGPEDSLIGNVPFPAELPLKLPRHFLGRKTLAFPFGHERVEVDILDGGVGRLALDYDGNLASGWIGQLTPHFAYRSANRLFVHLGQLPAQGDLPLVMQFVLEVVECSVDAMWRLEQHDRDIRLRDSIESAGTVSAPSRQEAFERKSPHR